MKGYNVTFSQFVGCTHCSNTWYEESKHNLGPTVINSARYKYNACDRCYDAENGQYRPEFTKQQHPAIEKLRELAPGFWHHETSK